MGLLRRFFWGATRLILEIQRQPDMLRYRALAASFTPLSQSDYLPTARLLLLRNLEFHPLLKRHGSAATAFDLNCHSAQKRAPSNVRMASRRAAKQPRPTRAKIGIPPGQLPSAALAFYQSAGFVTPSHARMATSVSETRMAAERGAFNLRRITGIAATTTQRTTFTIAK